MLGRTLVHAPACPVLVRGVARKKARPMPATCRAVNGREREGGFLVDSETLRNLSPEARRVFQEAQENIIEINKGRIRALEELKVAKKRISELEAQLQEALLDANQAAAHVAELKSVTATFTTQDFTVQDLPPPPPPPQQQLPPLPPPLPAPAAVQEAPPAPTPAAAPPVPEREPSPLPPPVAPQPPPPAPEPVVTVLYETSWNTAFLHYNADGKGWTTVPGAKMEQGTDQYQGKKVLKVACNRLEFVANNGNNDWDHPDQYESGGTKNYVVTQPGVYLLKGGKVNKVTT